MRRRCPGRDPPVPAKRCSPHFRPRHQERRRLHRQAAARRVAPGRARRDRHRRSGAGGRHPARRRATRRHARRQPPARRGHRHDGGRTWTRVDRPRCAAPDPADAGLDGGGCGQRAHASRHRVDRVEARRGQDPSAPPRRRRTAVHPQPQRHHRQAHRRGRSHAARCRSNRSCSTARCSASATASDQNRSRTR